MRQLRLPDQSRTLWIDALCINQACITEHNQHVALMGKIYSLVVRMVVWLGPSSDYSDIAMDFIATGQLAGHSVRSFVLGVLFLVFRSWFWRVWIAQELILSLGEPVVCCGAAEVGWDVFVTFMRQMLPAFDPVMGEAQGSCSRDGGSDKYDGCFEAVAKFMAEHEDPRFKDFSAGLEMVLRLAAMRDDGPGVNFTTQFLRTPGMESSDPRDVYFGLLGISTFQHEPLVADYSLPDDVVEEMALFAILREDPDYLDKMDRQDVFLWSRSVDQRKRNSLG